MIGEPFCLLHGHSLLEKWPGYYAGKFPRQSRIRRKLSAKEVRATRPVAYSVATTLRPSDKNEKYEW